MIDTFEDNAEPALLSAEPDTVLAGNPAMHAVSEKSTSAKCLQAGICGCCGRHKSSCECACCGRPRPACGCC